MCVNVVVHKMRANDGRGRHVVDSSVFKSPSASGVGLGIDGQGMVR